MLTPIFYGKCSLLIEDTSYWILILQERDGKYFNDHYIYIYILRCCYKIIK